MPPVALTPDEYATLRAAAETDRSALVVGLAGEAGLRTSEIPRVRPADFRTADADGDGDIGAVPATDGTDLLTVPDGDGGADRTVVVPAELAAAARRYAESAGIDAADPLIDLSERRVQMLVAEAGERAAEEGGRDRFRDVTPRTLRGTFARRLLVEGEVDPRIVRAVGGWETLDALEPHLSEPSDEAIVAALAGDGARAGDATPGDDAAVGESPAEGSAVRNEGARDWLTAGVEAVLDAGDRASLLSAVVEALASTPRWTTAWAATRDGSEGALSVAAAAGERAPLDAARTRVARGGDGASGAVSWTGVLDEREPATGTIAVDGEDRPVLAVPIADEETAYGVCCVVSADRPPGERERRDAELLGRVAARGLTTRRWRDLLHSDAVLRLEFRTSDARAFLPALTDRLGCRVELESTVVVSDAELLCYLSVEGARPPAVADVVAAVDGVADPRVIETREDGCRLSVVVSGGSPVRALTRRGAAIADATAENGRLWVVAEVPSGTDVGPIADGLRESFPDAQLVGRQVDDAPPITGSQLREAVTDRFTDRQRTALEAAYASGYFDWPRGSTAEEIADSMGVSSPTFHNHLRKAHRELLEAVFER